MMKVSKIMEWLRGLSEDEVGIDDGGLALRTEDGESYLEVGGIPIPEETETVSKLLTLNPDDAAKGIVEDLRHAIAARHVSFQLNNALENVLESHFCILPNTVQRRQMARLDEIIDELVAVTTDLDLSTITIELLVALINDDAEAVTKHWESLYEPESAATCPNCGHAIQAEWCFCPSCAEALPAITSVLGEAEPPAPGGQLGFHVINQTDGLPISPSPYATLAEAHAAIREFRERFVRQGYYRTGDGEKIPPGAIELDINVTGGGNWAMTFEEFRGTAREILSGDAKRVQYADSSAGEGSIYLDGLIIERTSEWDVESPGPFYLRIENQEYFGTEIEPLEKQLYDYAVRTGLIVESLK